MGPGKLIFRSVLLLGAALVSHLPATAADDPSLEEQLEKIENLRNAGDYEEALSLVKRTIEKAEELDSPQIEAEAMYQLALLHYFRNAFDEARATLEIGRAKARLNKLPSLEADFLSAEGVLEWKLGNLSLATPKLEAALAIQRETGEWINMASISNNLGIIAYSMKDFDAAVSHYEQALEWLGDRENDRLRASLYSNLAEVLIPLGDLENAEEYLYQALQIEQQANEPRSIAYTYFNLGELKAKQGQAREAISLYQKALDLQLSIEDTWAAALTRLKFAAELHKLEKTEAALIELEAGYVSASRLNALSLLRDYSLLLADIHLATGENGLADYYNGLHQYFSGKIGVEENNPSPLPAKFVAAGPVPVDEREGISLITPIQAATVLLLCFLITILVLENTRLRNRMRDL